MTDPLVLLLGHDGEQDMFRLSGDFACAALDPFDGVPPDENPSADTLAKAREKVSAFLVTLGRMPCAVTGHGRYGTLALHLLASFPCFRAAVISSAMVDPLSALALCQASPYTPGEDLHGQLMRLAGNAVCRELPDVTAPVYVLHGEKDTIVAPSQADELFVLMKALHPAVPSRLRFLPGESHVFSQEALDSLHGPVCAFLEENLKGQEALPW